jgi:hypothetical protein
LEIVVLVAMVVVFGLAIAGLIGSLLAFVGWLLVLPFKLLGLAFKAVAFLILLPLVVIAAIGGSLLFGAGVFVLPILPFVLVALFFVWLFRRGRPRPLNTT